MIACLIKSTKSSETLGDEEGILPFIEELENHYLLVEKRLFV